MDRERLIAELVSKGLVTDEGRLEIGEILGRGGNGVALLCAGETTGEVVAKVYIPPDKRDLDDQSLGRFRNEVKLASALRHPYVIPAIGSGTARIGAYVLPFYLMPYAGSTLRSMVGQPDDPDEIQRVARLFLEACLGVSCLHAHGIVHRDLKPENVLISREGTAWIADLGIAHIDPEFVSVSLRTIAAERLLNRDYYAPEQRFGDNAEVDGRADIYALGCILYELFTGTPPVRRDSPPVASVNSAFAALDPVIDRMTSYEPAARYQHLEAAIVDLMVALGWVAATIRGAREPEPEDVAEMNRLLRSANAANRSAGISLAIKLSTAALPTLHDLMGHGRREVRNAVATALGQIGDERSVPFLAAGLYGISRKASTFRPSVDTAAEALRRYPVERRSELLNKLDEPIRPDQLLLLIQDFDTNSAFLTIDALEKRGLLLLDWTETTLELLVRIDEARAWPILSRDAETLSGWTLSHLLPLLSIDHQLAVARQWLRSNRGDQWDWDRMVPSITNIRAPDQDLKPILEELHDRLTDYPGQARAEAQLRARVAERLRELDGVTIA